MPAYNAEKTVEESMRSVFAQTYKDYELLVIDDCSSDNTVDIVKRLIYTEAVDKPNARLLRLGKNAGVAAARNHGVANAKGEWVAFLDSDDLWREDKLQKQMEFIRATGAIISYTASAFINAEGVFFDYVLPARYELDYRDLLKANLLSCSSVIVRRDIIDKIKMPDGNLHEDYAAWLKILKEYKCFAYGLNEPLLIYRLSGNSKSANRFRSGMMNLNTYKHLGYNFFISFLFTFRYFFYSIRKRYYIYSGHAPLLPTLKSFAYTKILPLFRQKLPLQKSFSENSATQPIAIICDEMTWQNFSREAALVYLTPKNWETAFELPHNRPRVFFCEAAWSGSAQSGSCWRGQIYDDRRTGYENRHILLKILARCKADGIPTVFWAKEDPVYFKHHIYDFTDTALRFDCVLTTSEECVEKYKGLGHTNVCLWPFGFSPEIFHPPSDEATPREHVAIFAGSWYSGQPVRCADTEALFDFILSKGIPLRIYDRNRIRGRSTKPFPQKYQQYVNDSVDYKALGDLYRSVEYVANINTAGDSATMFARRVYEIMACGSVVISNDSKGMRKQFNGRVWFTGEESPSNFPELRKKNIDEVFLKHTNAARLRYLQERFLSCMKYAL
jgi:glycosyltransferase involved in cell wall biosynthesis